MNSASVLGYPGLMGQPGQSGGAPHNLQSPPGLNTNDHSVQLLQQLNSGNMVNNMMSNNRPSLNDLQNKLGGGSGGVGNQNLGNVNEDANKNNPIFHPHIEDPSLVNNPIWKLQLQLMAVSMQSLGQANVYARQNAMKKYLVGQQQQQQQHQQHQQQQELQGMPSMQSQGHMLPQSQLLQNNVPPPMNDAAMSLVDRTKQLLMELAADPSLQNDLTSSKSNSQSNNPNDTISTPTTPKVELNQAFNTPTSTTAILLQQKKLSQYNIDEDDEVEQMNRPMVLTDSQYDKQLWHAIDLSNLQIFNVNKNLFNYKFLTRLYLNGNNITEIPKMIKNLNNLCVLDLSHNKITEIPQEVGFCYQLKYLYLFDNMIKTLPWEMGNLSNLQFLGVEGNPLDRQLLKILTEKSVTGLIFYLRDNRPEVPLTNNRKIIEITAEGEVENSYDNLQIAEEHLSQDLLDKSFTVLSYNTLCQHYATPKMYRYTPSWALNWDYRREKLKEQILQSDSEIICLQEVESKTYEEFWAPLLQEHGYASLFHAKTRAKTMQSKESKKVDGCCVFYKKSKFNLLFSDMVDFSGVWMKHKNFQRTEDYLNRAMNKDNVAIYMKLEHIKSGETVWVVTTHLHWDPRFNDVKTFQVGILLDYLEELLKKHNNAASKQEVRKCPVVICGDLNSSVDSAVYELLSTGHVQIHKDIENRFYGYMSQKNFAHELALRSSYDCIGEMPFTNFTPSFTEVIDYIWYSTQSLRVRSVLGPIDSSYISKFIGFPNDKFPSDHIPLLARYEFVKGASTSSRKL